MGKKITIQTAGGRPTTLENCETVQDAYDALGLDGNYSAQLGPNAAQLTDEVPDYSFVSFSEKVKGGGIIRCN